MPSFSAKIQIIGVNPYVLLPKKVLEYIFEKAGKDKGAIQVKGTLNKNPFTQNLVKYSGKWRLYLNGPMREAAGIDVGDLANLLRRDQKPDLEGMIRRVLEGFRFLADLTAAEKALAADASRKKSKEAEALIAALNVVPA